MWSISYSRELNFLPVLASHRPITLFLTRFGILRLRLGIMRSAIIPAIQPHRIGSKAGLWSCTATQTPARYAPITTRIHLSFQRIRSVLCKMLARSSSAMADKNTVGKNVADNAGGLAPRNLPQVRHGNQNIRARARETYIHTRLKCPQEYRGPREQGREELLVARRIEFGG
jgi:hypothetical protein